MGDIPFCPERAKVPSRTIRYMHHPENLTNEMDANMAKDPTRDEMMAHLLMLHPEIGDDPFDAWEACYAFAIDHHGGQTSNLYEALCMSPFQPGPLWRCCAPGSMAEYYYKSLQLEFA